MKIGPLPVIIVSALVPPLVFAVISLIVPQSMGRLRSLAVTAIITTIIAVPVIACAFREHTKIVARVLASRLNGQQTDDDRRIADRMKRCNDTRGKLMNDIDSVHEERSAAAAAGIKTVDIAERGAQINEFVATVSSDIAVQCDKTTEASSAVNSIVTSLSEASTLMSRGDEMLDTTVREISRTILSIASAREHVDEQNAAVVETTSTIEEMTTQIHSVAESSRKAKELASALSLRARNGGGTVEAVVTAMREIEESSKQVRDIVTVIQGIAGQTNLLAMNASIEAAHAGQQGKGFAVVAAEIRKLAARSAANSTEISTIIKGILAKIENGVAIAAVAGKAIGTIVENADRTAELISEISVSNSEQDSAAGEVLNAVRTLNESSAKLTDIMQSVQESSNDATAIINKARERLGLTFKTVADISIQANQTIGLIIEMSSGASDAKEAATALSTAMAHYLSALNDIAARTTAAHGASVPSE